MWEVVDQPGIDVPGPGLEIPCLNGRWKELADRLDAVEESVRLVSPEGHQLGFDLQLIPFLTKGGVLVGDGQDEAACRRWIAGYLNGQVVAGRWPEQTG
jgi:hypothetical protein